ncbi:RNA-binding protein [Halorhabdus tiamatea]|uniref:Conserved hypothetical membrane protein n=1 Tax=Halorhabdus tiamatea SARL4B TaxID=1033806 RepID=F7PR79_9EURY|nr:hypothetical protein [Halorhabdus tiamatea]CCQ34494.1 conserved hypothetical membrane protein [Halorhabdus tiamatea SARL4B]
MSRDDNAAETNASTSRDDNAAETNASTSRDDNAAETNASTPRDDNAAETNASTPRDDTVAETDGLLAEDWLADLRDVPWIPGVVAGGVAWLFGYLLMAALFFVGPATLSAGSTVERLRGIGVIFYNAQFVNGAETLSGGGVQETVRFNLILEQTVTSVPTPVYFAIPVVAILAVGTAVGYLALKADAEYVTVSLLGVVMAAGYLLFAVAGTFLMELPVRWTLGTLVLEPDLLEAAAFGFAYPFVVGSVGALLGYALQQ